MKKESIEKYKLELKEVPLEATSFTKISCTSCHKEVPADNINIQDKIAKCGHCHIVFPFHKEIAGLFREVKVKQEVLRPEGIDLFYFHNELDITLQQPITVGEALLGSIPPIFALLFTFVYFLAGNLPAAVPIIFWAFSIPFLINLIFRSKQKIYLSIDDQYLSLKRRPKKLYKDRYYPVQNIDQIYVKSAHGRSSIHMIHNSIEGQKHITLISEIDSISKAHYLEQEIERHLGIEDRMLLEEGT